MSAAYERPEKDKGTPKQLMAVRLSHLRMPRMKVAPIGHLRISRFPLSRFPFFLNIIHLLLFRTLFEQALEGDVIGYRLQSLL
jgi:hypothetical protein